MKRAYMFCFLFTLFLLNAQVQEASTFNYIDPRSVDVPHLLAGPPGDGSPQIKAELAIVLRWQEIRTTNEVARAELEASRNPFLFAEILGPWFNPSNLPATDKLLRKAESDCNSISETAKGLWNHPRPPKMDSHIHPALDLPSSSSYPSGHATWGTCMALILSDLAPEYRKDLLTRGNQVGLDRVIVGLHFPSDVNAGRKLGMYIVERFQTNCEFHSDFTKARDEMDRFLATGKRQHHF